MRIQIIAAFVLVILLLISQAQAGCGKWVVRYPETDFLEDPTFDEAVKSSTGPTATVNEEADAGDSTKDSTKDSAKDSDNDKAEAKTSKEPAAKVLEVSGNWLVRLENLTGDTLNLILIQTGERLQGYGSLAENGAQIPATIVGSVTDDAANLDIKLVKDGTINNEARQYKLDMAMEDGELSGSYEYYLSDELAGEGNATATRS